MHAHTHLCMHAHTYTRTHIHTYICKHTFARTNSLMHCLHYYVKMLPLHTDIPSNAYLSTYILTNYTCVFI